MINTYPDNASMETKIYEEMRCLRSVMERILRVMDEGLFVDYQMEKYGKNYSRIKNEELAKYKFRTDGENCK